MIQFRKDVKMVPEYIYKEAKKVESFLIELTKLSCKYKINIAGCGCCGSPFLEDAERDIRNLNFAYDDLSWIEDMYGFYYEVLCEFDSGMVRITGREENTDD